MAGRRNVKHCIEDDELQIEVRGHSFPRLQLSPIDHTDFSKHKLNGKRASRHINSKRIKDFDYNSSSFRGSRGKIRCNNRTSHSGEKIKPSVYRNKSYRKSKNRDICMHYERKNLNRDNTKINVNLDSHLLTVRHNYNEDTELSNNDEFAKELQSEFHSNVLFEYADDSSNSTCNEGINLQCDKKNYSLEQQIFDDVQKSCLEFTPKSEIFHKRNGLIEFNHHAEENVIQSFEYNKKRKLCSAYKFDVHNRCKRLRLSDNGKTLTDEALYNNKQDSLFGDDCKRQFRGSSITVNFETDIETNENVESSFKVLRSFNESDSSRLKRVLNSNTIVNEKSENPCISNTSKLKKRKYNTDFSYKMLIKLFRNMFTLNSRTLYRLKVSARFRNTLYTDILRWLIPVISRKHAEPSQLKTVFSSFETNLKQYIVNNRCRHLSNNSELQASSKNANIDSVKENPEKLLTTDDRDVSSLPVSIEAQIEQRLPVQSSSDLKKLNLLKNVEYSLLQSRSRLVNHSDELETLLHHFMTEIQSKDMLYKKYDALTSTINQVKEDILLKDTEIHKSHFEILDHYTMIMKRKQNCAQFERMCSAVGLHKKNYKIPEENKTELSNKLTELSELMRSAVDLLRLQEVD